MRFHFASMKRPKASAKALVSHVPSLKLHQAQSIAAQTYGYRDWHELEAVTAQDPTPSPDFKDMPLHDYYRAEQELTVRLGRAFQNQTPQLEPEVQSVLAFKALMRLCFHQGQYVEVDASRLPPASDDDPFLWEQGHLLNAFGMPTYYPSKVDPMNVVEHWGWKPSKAQGVIDTCPGPRVTDDPTVLHRERIDAFHLELLFEYSPHRPHEHDEYDIHAAEVCVSLWSGPTCLAIVSGMAGCSTANTRTDWRELYDYVEGLSDAGPAMLFERSRFPTNRLNDYMDTGFILMVERSTYSSVHHYADLTCRLAKWASHHCRRDFGYVLVDTSTPFVKPFTSPEGALQSLPANNDIEPIKSHQAFAMQKEHEHLLKDAFENHAIAAHSMTRTLLTLAPGRGAFEASSVGIEDLNLAVLSALESPA